jgi:hypothetical protein
MKIKDLEVIYIKVQCPKCKRKWGIFLDGKSLDTIPDRYLICDNCSSGGTNLKDKEIRNNVREGFYKDS